jgi:hypothetical protein
MKEIRISLEDKEYRKIQKLKGKRTWREYILNGCGERDGENNNITKSDS